MSTYGLVVPALNINGTSAKELLAQIREAWHGVREARRLHGLTIPHGRDYQTVDPRLYRLAREQHHQRTAALAAVEDDLERIATGINDQMIDH
jgi:hypothetical protein